MAYPGSCHILYICEVAHSYSQQLQIKIEQLEDENRDMNKEKERQSESKLNRINLFSERRMTELEGSVTTFKSKLSLKERKAGELKEKYDYKNSIESSTR